MRRKEVEIHDEGGGGSERQADVALAPAATLAAPVPSLHRSGNWSIRVTSDCDDSTHNSFWPVATFLLLLVLSCCPPRTERCSPVGWQHISIEKNRQTAQ